MFKNEYHLKPNKSKVYISECYLTKYNENFHHIYLKMTLDNIWEYKNKHTEFLKS